MFVAATLGFCSVGIPSLIRLESLPTHSLIQFLTASPQNVSTVSLSLLFASGVMVGMIDPTRPFVYGLCTMAFFPALAVLEKTIDITTHAHFPLEFLYYVLLSSAAIAGAMLAKEIRKVS